MLVDDIVFYGISIGFSLILCFFGQRKEFRYSKLFRLLYLILLPVAAIKIEANGPNIYLVPLYIGIAMVSACYFMGDDKKKQRSYICAIACVFMIGGFVFNVNHPNYRNKNTYVEEYEEIFLELKNYYAAGDLKEINWDTLHDEYFPLIEEAAKKNDPYLFYEALRLFAQSFHDGHVYMYMTSDYDKYEEAYIEKYCGYDYGFSLVSLEDGTCVFVNVDTDSEAYEKGVRNFYQITSFDGKNMEQLLQESFAFFYEFPDSENEDFFRAVFATANGGEQVSLTFLDGENKETEITLKSRGSNKERIKDTIDKLLGQSKEDANNNLSVRMVSEDIGCIVINQMDIEANVRYGMEEGEDYSGLAKMVAAQIESLKDQGATKLIIDMRGNYGGYLDVSSQLASYFTSEEMFAAAEGKEIGNTNTYECIGTSKVKPNNIWGDGEIVILVNCETISAGELFIHMMMQLDNVTVMGFTKSCGSAMGVTQFETEHVVFAYPQMIMLDENGEILIDAGSDRVMKMEPDIIIPFDMAACKSIFMENEDYVINYAISYLTNK